MPLHCSARSRFLSLALRPARLLARTRTATCSPAHIHAHRRPLRWKPPALYIQSIAGPSSTRICQPYHCLPAQPSAHPLMYPPIPTQQELYQQIVANRTTRSAGPEKHPQNDRCVKACQGPRKHRPRPISHRTSDSSKALRFPNCLIGKSTHPLHRKLTIKLYMHQACCAQAHTHTILQIP